MTSAASTKLPIGLKVMVQSESGYGFGEVSGDSSDDGLTPVSFYTDGSHAEHIQVPFADLLLNEEIPPQTRCYLQNRNGFAAGHLIEVRRSPSRCLRTFLIELPGRRVIELREDELHVRSGLPVKTPLALLRSLCVETPYYFEWRSRWVRAYIDQCRLAGNLTGLLSASVDFFPHQVAVVRRVLQDPEMRYLLADEVGLGKTIEAGIILHQLRIDSPQSRIACFVPSAIVDQWQGEITDRLKLASVEIYTHEALTDRVATPYDLTVAPLREKLLDASHPIFALYLCGW